MFTPSINNIHFTVAMTIIVVIYCYYYIHNIGAIKKTFWMLTNPKFTFLLICNTHNNISTEIGTHYNIAN